MSWELCLNTVLAVAQPILTGDELRCAVIGSAATAVQGCRVTPRDIDLLAIEPGVPIHFAKLMSAHTPEQCPHAPDHADWLSSAETPLWIGPDDYGFTWRFGRWLVEGMKVEIAHIVAPQGFPTSEYGAGVWEAGPEIWPHVRRVSFGEYRIPVVPLEIQLETAMQRGLEERAAEIVSVLQNSGYDHDLLRRALTKEHLQAFEAMVVS